MICPDCKKQVQRVRTIFRGGTQIEGCLSCISGETSRIMPNVSENGGKCTAAHAYAIKHRKLDQKTGEVYQDVGRTYFT